MNSITTDLNEGWVLNTPAPLRELPAPAPMDRSKKSAMRAHAAGIARKRAEQGLAADGRILDMTTYAAHLRAAS